MTTKDWLPKILVCAGTVVLKDSKVLLIREAKGHHAGVWGIPWGVVEGKLEDGSLDTPERTAVRETLEEAGVEVEITGFLGFQNHASSKGEPRLYFIFLADYVSGEPTADGDETDQAEFLSLEQINSWPEPIDEFVLWTLRRVLNDEHTRLHAQKNNPYSPHLGFF